MVGSRRTKASKGPHTRSKATHVVEVEGTEADTITGADIPSTMEAAQEVLAKEVGQQGGAPLGRDTSSSSSVEATSKPPTADHPAVTTLLAPSPAPAEKPQRETPGAPQC